MFCFPYGTMKLSFCFLYGTHETIVLCVIIFHICHLLTFKSLLMVHRIIQHIQLVVVFLLNLHHGRTQCLAREGGI